MSELYRAKNEAFFCAEGQNGLVNFGSSHHSSVEVVLLLRGETKVWVENKGAALAKEGDVIIIFPNQQYRYDTQKKEKYIILTADIKRLGDFLGVLSSYTPATNVIKGAARDDELLELARNILKTYGDNKSEYRNTVLKGYVTAFLGKILPMTELKKNEIEKPDTLSEIIDYCRLHFNEKLTLETLERELHISKYYVSHVINERLGEGFNEYLNSIRINEACRLLVESDKTVNEISERVGFGTVRSFDRAFKREKGETAREYRKRNSKKE